MNKVDKNRPVIYLNSSTNTKQNTLLQFVINAIITFFQDVKRTIRDIFFN